MKLSKEEKKRRHRESSKQYRKVNKDAINERKKLYRAENPEKIAEQRKAYYLASKEKIDKQTRAANKRYYDRHKDETAFKERNCQKYAEYSKRNRGRIAEYEKQRYKKDPSKAIARVKGWRVNNPEKCRAISLKTGRKARAVLSDGYVRGVLTKSGFLTAKDIPQPLVGAKREHLRVLRLIKDIEDGNTRNQKRQRCA